MDFSLLITILGTGLGIIIAMGALILTLFLWSRGEANADRRDIVNLIISIKEEMKDFHVTLERQDAEFKNRICLIEERNK
jgi:hypothetical protein